MTLEQFLGVLDGQTRSLAVINRTDPEPFQTMVQNLFENQQIIVEERTSESFEENTMVLLEDGEIVAKSAFGDVQDAILMVNSDLFMTGTRGLERTDVPDVIDGLAGTRFSLRGYPASNTEKLLLILISRHIERIAFENRSGTLRSSFQHLKRLEDERGTRRVYERIADTDVDVHLYGQPGWRPSREFPVTIHAGHKPEFRNSWFVVYRPTTGEAKAGPAALLAIEIEKSRWEGFWTYDESLIDDIADYIRHEL